MLNKRNILVSWLLLTLFVSLETASAVHHFVDNSHFHDCHSENNSHDGSEDCPVCLFSSILFKPSSDVGISTCVIFIKEQIYKPYVLSVLEKKITSFQGRAPPLL